MSDTEPHVLLIYVVKQNQVGMVLEVLSHLNTLQLHSYPGDVAEQEQTVITVITTEAQLKNSRREQSQFHDE